MSNIKTLTSLAAASLLATGLAACGGKETFEAKPMEQGYQNTTKEAPATTSTTTTESKTAEGKCGEGKCGAEHGKNAEGKCGEGKCGAAHGKNAEGKCGEGKCGGSK